MGRGLFSRLTYWQHCYRREHYWRSLWRSSSPDLGALQRPSCDPSLPLDHFRGLLATLAYSWTTSGALKGPSHLLNHFRGLVVTLLYSWTPSGEWWCSFSPKSLQVAVQETSGEWWSFPDLRPLHGVIGDPFHLLITPEMIVWSLRKTKTKLVYN